MPDEFKLRPYPTTNARGRLWNQVHEQGARALAAAIHARIEKLCNSCGDDDAADLMGEGYDEGYLAAMTDMEAHIHRLVPPKENVVQ